MVAGGEGDAFGNIRSRAFRKVTMLDLTPFLLPFLVKKTNAEKRSHPTLRELGARRSYSLSYNLPRPH